MLVAKTTLSTLTGYVDWIPIEIITSQNNLLLQVMLRCILNINEFILKFCFSAVNSYVQN